MNIELKRKTKLKNVATWEVTTLWPKFFFRDYSSECKFPLLSKMFLFSVMNWCHFVYIDSYCQLDRIVNHLGDGLLGVPMGNYFNYVS